MTFKKNENLFNLTDAAKEAGLSKTAFRNRLEQLVKTYPEKKFTLPLTREQIQFVMDNFIDKRSGRYSLNRGFNNAKN